jgi:hypothetical protein
MNSGRFAIQRPLNQRRYSSRRLHIRDTVAKHRREFFHTSAGALAAAGAQTQTPQPAASRKANLKLGTQHGDSDDILKVMAALGVNYICGHLPSAKMDENGPVESLTRHREKWNRSASSWRPCRCRSAPRTL